MKASDFKKNFPSGAVVPEMLLKLLAFQNESNQFYSGHFELTDDGVDTALAYFNGDKQAASQFIVFGTESDGSVLAFWLYEGRKLEDAPIVDLGSEGGGFLLANSLEEFFSLLAVGPQNVGCGPYSSDESDEPAPRLEAFRKWLKREFGISRPEEPGLILMDTADRHPSLQKWLLA